MEPETKCSVCEKITSLKCSNCFMNALYCSKECQKKAWPTHKIVHNLMPKLVNVESMEDVNHNVGLLGPYVTSLDVHCKSFIDPDNKQLAELRFFGLLHPMPLAKCYAEVRNSPVHGRGLFLKKDVTRIGIVITFYPSHIITKGSLVDYSAVNDLSESQVNHYLNEYKLSIDSPSSTQNESLVSITGDPRKIKDNRLLGHMANDGGYNIFEGIPVERLKDVNVCITLITDYYETVKKRVNCCLLFNTTHSVGLLLSTRSIKKDCEIFVMYGAVYWAQIEYGMGYASRYPFLKKNIDYQDHIIAFSVISGVKI